MQCPSLNDLPSRPPLGKSGWPWTKASPTLPETMPAGQPWPRVTIVTPSYNQGEFLEEAIRSVLLQGYPNLEYIIMDGGSTDNSVDIIRQYAPWLTHWQSKPDSGQAAAIQAGWDLGTSPVLAYLNSDDSYLPGAVGTAVQNLWRNPETPAVNGGELRIDPAGQVIKVKTPYKSDITRWDLLNLNFISQPATFLRRTALDAAGGIDTTFNITFDAELWIRLSIQAPIKTIPFILATTRWYPETKTLSRRPEVMVELARALEKADIYSNQWSAKERSQLETSLNRHIAKHSLEHYRSFFNALRPIYRLSIAGHTERQLAVHIIKNRTVWHINRFKARFRTKSTEVPTLHWSEWLEQYHDLPKLT